MGGHARARRQETLQGVVRLRPGAFAAMFFLVRAEPRPEHRLRAVRLIVPKSPQEKDAFRRQAITAPRPLGSVTEKRKAEVRA